MKIDRIDYDKLLAGLGARGQAGCPACGASERLYGRVIGHQYTRRGVKYLYECTRCRCQYRLKSEH